MKNIDNFLDLGLKNDFSKIFNKINYKKPFLIQKLCIPYILDNFDILSIANTGSGKTAAFVIPIIDKINKNINYIQVLILSPTREIVIQTKHVIDTFSKYLKWINSLSIYGGKNFIMQKNDLKKIQHIIISTPGRLIDHINKKNIDLSKVSILVIDEFDEMFKMGFIEDIKKINSYIPKNRQTLLFSATLKNEIKLKVKSFVNLNKFKEIIINDKNNLSITQYYYIINSLKNKKDILVNFINNINYKTIIVFVNKKIDTINLYNFLKQFYNCYYISSDVSQFKREKIIKIFILQKYNNCILIATDIISRGLDIKNVDWIINFDFPNNKDIYIHRIGRTGRANNFGKSLSLIYYKNDIKILNELKKDNLKLINFKLDNIINNNIENKINNIYKYIIKKYLCNNLNDNNFIIKNDNLKKLFSLINIENYEKLSLILLDIIIDKKIFTYENVS
ncbi:cold-shock DeaD box ATP-dependent RNA helicase [endosymbiont of Euscepes postfasciatus]|uniref:DEAD/DEAH box helicase n=1 Tax=endosymbiont of Euscepes postfasciatus TaxID=650377 RepID=UPI000DC6D431|nr:DEAD/DEAH box helicase [endosymbiont of Euscepes postfasciatus]BBA84569.1 cold-shock DeaD box ATP-dependent RNA helicase [endosymbiont of Euscepes postfasciatus]